MLRSLLSYRLTSCSNAATSPLLQAWTRATSSCAVSAAHIESPISLVVPITTPSFQAKYELLHPPSAVGAQRLCYHCCSAVVAVHWPRSLLILWTSNVGSPERPLVFLPRSSTRSPGLSVSFCLLVRLSVCLSFPSTSLSPLPVTQPCSLAR